MSNQFGPPSHPDTYLKSKQMDLESGLLGKLFGSSANAPMNIAGLVALLVLVPLVVYTFVNVNSESKSTVLDFWKICSPIIGMILGFVFGKKG